jgi:predicted transcriptional regulator YheO
MTEVTEAQRHRGRRSPADPKTVEKHRKLILEAQRKRKAAETDLQKRMNILAERIDKAMAAGVATNFIADELGVSRQMVYKLVRERVDGKPLGSQKLPSGANGSAPSE